MMGCVEVVDAIDEGMLYRERGKLGVEECVRKLACKKP